MNVKKDVQDQFGKNAQSYVSSPIHSKGKDLTKMIEIAQIKGDELTLDIATGGGHTANGFAPFVKKVIAFDLTNEMLQAAEKFIRENGHNNVEFVKGDAENLPFEDRSFDIVTCRIAPHHFPNVGKFVSEVFRCLKPGGQFLLNDNMAPENHEMDLFYNSIEKIRDYSHFRAWKKTEWIKMLEDAGFLIQEMYRFEKTFAFEDWCSRMELPEDKKENLNQRMVQAVPEIKKQFQIDVKNQHVQSFKGEAFLFRSLKRAD